MFDSRFFAATFFAATAILAASQGRAETLANLDASVVNARVAKGTEISNRTGFQVKRGMPASFGRSADPDFRSMVKLSMRFEQPDGRIMTEHCGGTVIGSRWIVTAAHCVSPGDGSQWDRIEIVTGNRDLDSTHVIRRTAYEAIIHSGFEYASLSNDIALLRLKQPLPRTVVPAKMDALNAPSVGSGDLARAAGWPITGAKAGLKRLQSTSVAVTEPELPGYITVKSPTGQVEGVCQGESGGPLMSWSNGTAQLTGVLSGIEPNTQNANGEPCMIGGYAMYFTPIATHRQWIDNVRALCDLNPKACAPGSSQNLASSKDQKLNRILASQRSNNQYFSNYKTILLRSY